MVLPALRGAPVEDGILLRTYWFSVSGTEQQRRFRDRLDDPMRQWKLSAIPVIRLPARPPSRGYQRPPRDEQTYVPDRAATLR